MKEKEIFEAIEYFKQKLTSVDSSHSDTTSGVLFTHILLREMAQVRRAMGSVRNSEFEAVRRSMGAWFKYFRWKQSKPSPIRGQMLFGSTRNYSPISSSRHLSAWVRSVVPFRKFLKSSDTINQWLHMKFLSLRQRRWSSL
jgi:hypothetical protein